MSQFDGLITAHFSRKEAACHDGTPLPDEYESNAAEVARRAEIFRLELGRLAGKEILLTVRSWYRTVSYNAKCEGSSSVSQHLTASAMDLHNDSYTGKQLADIYQTLIDSGQVPDGGVGTYDTFVHIDIRPEHHRWDNRSSH